MAHVYYKKSKTIGSGATSRIYLGERIENAPKCIPEFVAIKQIRKLTLSRHHMWEEISIMKKFNHKNILKLYDVIEDNEFISLYIEYCNGGDLSCLKEKELADDRLLFDIILQIIEGWKYIKDVDDKLIHRDIKLQNILLSYSDDDEKVQVKIADFGFCMSGQRFNQKQKKMLDMTICGSPMYMAPEMFRNAHIIFDQYDDKIDVWSLGIIIYKLLFSDGQLFTHPIPEIQNIDELVLAYNDQSISDKWQNCLYKIYKKCDNPKCVPLCTRCFLYDLMKLMLQVDKNKRISWQEIFDTVRDYITEGDSNPMPIYENYFNPKCYHFYHNRYVVVCVPDKMTYGDYISKKLNFLWDYK